MTTKKATKKKVVNKGVVKKKAVKKKVSNKKATNKKAVNKKVAKKRATPKRRVAPKKVTNKPVAKKKVAAKKRAASPQQTGGDRISNNTVAAPARESGQNPMQPPIPPGFSGSEVPQEKLPPVEPKRQATKKTGSYVCPVSYWNDLSPADNNLSEIHIEAEEPDEPPTLIQRVAIEHNKKDRSSYSVRKAHPILQGEGTDRAPTANKYPPGFLDYLAIWGGASDAGQAHSSSQAVAVESEQTPGFQRVEGKDDAIAVEPSVSQPAMAATMESTATVSLMEPHSTMLDAVHAVTQTEKKSSSGGHTELDDAVDQPLTNNREGEEEMRQEVQKPINEDESSSDTLSTQRREAIRHFTEEAAKRRQQKHN